MRSVGKRDEIQDCSGLVPFEQSGLGVTEHMAFGILRQENQNRLLAAAAFGEVVPLHKLVGPEKRNGVKIQIEALALEQFLLPQNADPEFAELLVGLWGKAMRLGL